MRILIFGSDGFIGRNVYRELQKNTDNIVYGTVRGQAEENPLKLIVDLNDKDSILQAFETSSPDVAVNCAGVLVNDGDLSINARFTKSIIDQASLLKCVKLIIISGSASEYGKIKDADLPVNENTSLGADFGYGLSKLLEERAAFECQKQYGIKVVVLRVFNPLGVGMAEKFLIKGLIRQIDEIRSKKTDSIELSRLDSKRDYIFIKDVAAAYRAVVEGSPKEGVYNIGSGHSTTNAELLDTLLSYSGLDARPNIIEVSKDTEPLVACQADISRISNEFGWRPKYTINDAIKEVVNG